jgi:hypothetical protein
VRVVLVSSRPPWPPYSGDRLRTTVWLEALAPRAQVTLVAPWAPPPSGLAPFRHVPVPHSLGALLAGLPRTVMKGLPATALLAAGRRWRRACEDAERLGGPFDVGVVVLVRTDPWVFARLAAPRLVLDGIDSLAENLRERARAARGAARLLWHRESLRFERLERDVATRYSAVVVVNGAESGCFGPGVRVVPHGVEIRPLAEGERRIDVAFWGRLAYFANRDAAHMLLERIWPLVRRELPTATLMLGGADVPAFVRRAHGRDGVTVASPIGDRESLLRGVASLAPHALLAEGPDALAAAIVGLLRDRRRARALGLAAREVATREYRRDDALGRLAAIALGSGA